MERQLSYQRLGELLQGANGQRRLQSCYKFSSFAIDVLSRS